MLGVTPGLLEHGLRWLGDVASKVLGSFSKRLQKDFSPGFALALETARWGGQC